MKKDTVIITWGIINMIMGTIGGVSKLNEPANTATFVFLTGMIILVIGFY